MLTIGGSEVLFPGKVPPLIPEAMVRAVRLWEPNEAGRVAFVRLGGYKNPASNAFGVASNNLYAEGPTKVFGVMLSEPLLQLSRLAAGCVKQLRKRPNATPASERLQGPTNENAAR